MKTTYPQQHNCPDGVLYRWEGRKPKPVSCPRCKARIDKGNNADQSPNLKTAEGDKMEQTAFVIKDDYDQTTICVVVANSENEALTFARKEYADVIEGDLYAIETQLHVLN